ANGVTAVLRGQVLDAEGRPVAHAEVTALARRPFRPGDYGLREDVLRAGRADKRGRFRLTVPADFPTLYPDRQVVLVASAPGHPPPPAPRRPPWPSPRRPTRGPPSCGWGRRRPSVASCSTQTASPQPACGCRWCGWATPPGSPSRATTARRRRSGPCRSRAM